MIDSKPGRLGLREPPLPREIAVLLGLHEGDLRELEALAFTVDVGLREDALAEHLLGPGEVELRPLVRGLRRLHAAVHLGELEGRRVGPDLEEGVPGLHAIADLDAADLHDARNLGFDRELLAGLDLADRHGLLGDRAELRVDELHAAVGLLPPAAEGVNARGGPREDDERDQGFQQLAHVRSLPGGARFP